MGLAQISRWLGLGRQARVLATAMALSPQLPKDEETERLRDLHNDAEEWH